MESPTTIKSAMIIYALSVVLTIPSLLINANYAPEEQSRNLILILGFIFMIPYIVLGYFIYRQKNWARLIYSIFGVLGIISQLALDQVGEHHISVVYLNWLQTFLLGVIIILLFMPKSNACFNK